MKRRRDSRRELARKISGAKLKEPPELCGRCVWAMKESGRPACPFPRCVKRKTVFQKAFTAHKTDTETGSKAGSIRPPRRDRRA